MRPGLWIPLAVAAALTACSEQPQPVRAAGSPANAPNVLLISVDTLRADRLNCYGYEDHALSPHIDALARDGILFENHISASPWTTPSHMSLLTSLYPTSHGVIQSFGETMKGLRAGTFNALPEERLTLADALQTAGWATAAFTGGITLDPKIGFEQGFSTYTTSMYKLNDSNVKDMTDWLAAHRSGPWFVFWHTFEVHGPYLHTDFLPEKYVAARAEYDEMATRLADGESLGKHSNNNRAVQRFLKDRGIFKPEVCEALYLGGILSLDRWIGRVVETLRSLGLYERTMIVFTSDHGDEFAEHNPSMFYDRHGHSVFEELVHIPLIVKLPGQRAAGTRVEGVTRAIDVMPTILEQASVDPASNEMQGDSLREMWEDPASAEPRIAFAEGAAFAEEIKGVRTGRHKYVIRIAPDDVQRNGRSFIPERVKGRMLFDLTTDPGEKRDLLAGGAQAAAKGTAAELDGLLRHFVSTQRGQAGEVELDPETIERLRALGYVK